MLQFKHPWHLVRCTECRHFMISSAPKCPNCAAWRPSARIVSFGLPLVAFGLVLLTAVFAFQVYQKTQKQLAEDREVFIQQLQQQPRP